MRGYDTVPYSREKNTSRKNNNIFLSISEQKRRLLLPAGVIKSRIKHTKMVYAKLNTSGIASLVRGCSLEETSVSQKLLC